MSHENLTLWPELHKPISSLGVLFKEEFFNQPALAVISVNFETKCGASAAGLSSAATNEPRVIVDLAILPTFAKSEFRRVSRGILQFLTSQHEIGDGRGLSGGVAGFDLVLSDVLLTHRLDLQGRLTVLLFHLKKILPRESLLKINLIARRLLDRSVVLVPADGWLREAGVLGGELSRLALVHDDRLDLHRESWRFVLRSGLSSLAGLLEVEVQASFASKEGYDFLEIFQSDT